MNLLNLIQEELKMKNDGIYIAITNILKPNMYKSRSKHNSKLV